MRIKYYIRGIGIGIIFATLVLTISFYFGKGSFAKEKLSDEEIIERATELGMVMEATTEEGTEEGTEENTEEDSENNANDLNSDNSDGNTDSQNNNENGENSDTNSNNE